MTAKESPSIRRGDLVRLSDGQIVCVVSTRGGYIHTTAGTYGPWQLERLDTSSDCGAIGAPSSSSSSSSVDLTGASRLLHDIPRRRPG
jgi:hypothetical protein